MRTVSLNFPDEFLRRLDEWAKSRRMKRNAAIMEAVERYLVPEGSPEPGWLGEPRLVVTDSRGNKRYMDEPEEPKD